MQAKTEIQNEIMQKMTPTQKVRLALKLYYSAWELKIAWLKQIHNDWSDNQIEQEVKRIFGNARS